MSVRVPLSLRVLLLGFLASILLWVVLDRYQTARIGTMLQEEAVERLNNRGHRDRLRLDHHIRAHYGYVHMLADQHAARARLLADVADNKGATLREGPPSWLPHRSMRRLFSQPDAFVVVDVQGRTRVVHRLREVPLPDTLVQPDRRMLLASQAEPLLNFFEGRLFLVATAPIGDGAGWLAGLAMLDDEFLRRAQGPFLDEESITVMMAGEPQRILVSSAPDRVAPGTPVSDLRGDYLLTGKGFLDYGFSEARAGFATLVPRTRLAALTAPVLGIERTQRTVLAAAFGTFLMIVLAAGVTRLRRLSRRVAAFMEQTFDVPASVPASGNELLDLERQFERLAWEVLGSRAALKAEARQRLSLLAEANARLEDEVRTRTQDLRQALAEAQKATLSKNRFFAAASHDLRQPLQAARLFEAVLRQQLAGTPSEPVLDRLSQSVGSAEMLLGALLDVSRIEAGVIEPHAVPFRIGSLLGEVERDFALAAKQSGCNLRVVDSGVVVWGDPLLAGRILRNLVSNAIKHAPRGGVVVGARRLPGGMRVEVWDEGPGISQDELPSIFEEFYQLGNPERDREKGLGLGLAIARKLAALCAWPLEVRSTVGKGSVFSLTLPIADATAAAEPTIAAIH